uniref:Uncharacterized protein n=1 Tax=Arion vulgaris TaxID=1028688 RepID=A0A0B7AF78_9EUPU
MHNTLNWETLPEWNLIKMKKTKFVLKKKLVFDKATADLMVSAYQTDSRVHILMEITK